MRNLQELEMHGITGEAAQNIAAEQDKDAATTLFREAWDKRSPEDIQAGIRKRAAMLDAAQATQANPDLPTRRIEENPDGTLTHIIEQNGQAIYSTNDPAAADLALVNFTSMVDRGRITGTTNGIVEALSFFNQVNEAAKRGDDIQKFILENTPRNLLDEYEANPTEQNLDNLFKTVATIGQDISEPAELANFPVLASNQGALAEGIFKSVIRIYEGATGDKVVRDVAQDNLKRAIAEGRIKMEWVRENLNQIIPQIESNRISQKLRTETDTDVIESFSDVALAYMRGNIRDEQIPAGLRGFLRRMAIVVKDIFRRAYKLKRLVAEGKVDANFESFLADSVGLNQQARVDTASNRVSKDIITDGGQMLMDFSIGSRTNAVSTDTPAIRASNATITGPANYSIGAFHGTPHKVDKFSTAKIGTGEGAQAYGWGLYFAENRGVGEQYRNALAQKNTAERFAKNNRIQAAVQKLDSARLSSDAVAIKTASRELDQLSLDLENELSNTGNLYTVDLDVEPEDLLDWDKPFSEQSPKVQAALKAVQSDHLLWKDTISGKNGKPVGGAIYKTLTATWPDAEFSRDGIDPKKKASEALLAAGIPGIRYLDGGSRSDGEGTYNYVAFDENLIKITEENGNRIPASQAFAGPATGVAVENGRAYSPIVRDLLQRRAAGEDIPRSVIDQAINDNFPAQLVEPPKTESELPSRATIDDAINEGQRRDQIAKSNIQPGEAVTIRQDVPAMTRKGVGVVTIKGKSGNSYDAAARISDPQFILNEKKSLEIGMGGAKGPHIAIRGKWSSDQSMPADLNQWTQVGFNPDRHSFYYDRATMKQVVGGSEAYQIGNTVFVKDAQFGDGQISNISYSIGKKNTDRTNVSNFLNQVRTQPRGGKPISLEIGKLDGAVLQNLPEGFQGVSGFPIKIDEDLIRKNDNLSKQKKSLQDLRIQIPTDEDYQLLSEFINSADRVSLGQPRKDGTTTLEFRNSENPKVAATAIRTKAGYLAVVRFVGEEVALPLTEPNEGRLELTSETASQNQSATTDGKVNYSIGIARNTISQVSKKDDASRVGTAKLGTAKVPKNTPQDSNVSGDNVPDDLLAKQMEKMNYAHLPKNILSEKDPKKKRRKLINWFKKNLLALHDAFPEEFRARATHWYDGANRIAKEMGSQFQASVEQASGVIAVFSPQKDWFMNVAQAEQFMKLWTNSQDVVLEESLVRAEIEGIIEAATVADKQKRKKVDGETKEQTAERREYNKALDKLEKEKRRKIVEQVIGKTIRQLDATPTLQGWGIRVLAQVTFGRNYRNLSPEGDRLGMATNDDGALSKNGWGSTNEIEKAVRIMKDGSLKNISDNLGNEHKARNFYNNIVAPNTPYGDATIDTHAVAAAHLMPYGAKATEVGHNFGSGMNGSEVLGISGVYHLYLDAYREAAADRGILPRQMQSITWEAIRLVYPAATNNAATLAKSQKTWKDLTDDSARNILVGGRIPSPVWAGANDNRESQALSSGLQEDGSGDVSGGGLLSGVRPTGAGRDGGVNYSIASQSEIDRVNRALGGMNRGPDERLKVYQRAKQKFSKLMAWNSDELAAMADTGSDDSQIRRTQILQGLGELDGIMSVLPPEVRGRVGGYTKLAGIAPHDVFKDGVKVSEVSGMNGAIISAWMREGQNIGQAGKQVSLPPGYTATENLSTKRADKAIADFFRDRIKKIDTELEKVLVREYTEAIAKAVKQSRPKAGDNGVRKSTLGAETQKFADMVQRATLLDDEATPKRMAEIEAALTNPDATAEDISALSEEWSILNTFGDLDNRSSETLAQGLDWLKGQLQMGREAWRIKEQARIDEQRARASATIEWLGKGTAKKRNATKTKSELASDLANHYLLSHANFEQFVTAIFPPEIASRWAEKLRKADEASQTAEIRDRKGILDAVRAGAKAANMSTADALLWLKGDQKNAVAYLEGRKVKDERIAIDLAQKIVTGEADRSKLTDADIETLRNELAALPADTQKEYVTIKRVIFRGNDVKLDMSRGKAMQYLLSWNQPDVQIKMRKEGWTDESATDLKALVNDPVSRSVINYLQNLYGKGAGIVNPVYSRMFGMNMPQVKNYAPTRFLNAKDTPDISLDGSPTATGTTPSFAKSRVTHSAKIAPEDALTVAQGYIAQQAHWVHFAELAREFRAILSNPEVRESIKQTQGESVLKDAELWADQLEQRGGNKAREVAWINAIIGTAISGKAVSLLGFNLKTFAMNLDNTIRFALALDMKQVVSALSNPATITEDIQTVWESNAVQNRLQGGATAEARFLLSRYAGKPNFGAKIAEASMTPHNWLDSAATSISSAIVYRANLNDALAAGMPENLAKQAALDAASQAIYRFAQPVSFGQKSIVENSGGMLAKTFFLFMSDPRLKTAILADAARGLATGRGDKWTHIRRILVVETMAVLSHVVSNAFRDTFSDDDDDEIWNLGGFAKAMLLAPLQGFFFAGTVGELAISKLTGQKTFNSTTQNPLLSAMEQAVRAGSNLEDAFNLDDPDAMFKEWNNIFRSMALSP